MNLFLPFGGISWWWGSIRYGTRQTTALWTLILVCLTFSWRTKPPNRTECPRGGRYFGSSWSFRVLLFYAGQLTDNDRWGSLRYIRIRVTVWRYRTCSHLAWSRSCLSGRCSRSFSSSKITGFSFHPYFGCLEFPRASRLAHSLICRFEIPAPPRSCLLCFPYALCFCS